MQLTDSVVALVKLTVLALVIAPVSDLINSTVGIPLKLVPVIFIVVAELGAIVWLTLAIVGFVSPVGWAIQDKVPDPFVLNTWPLDPVLTGKISVYVAFAEWGGACMPTPWLFWLQFKTNFPSALDPSPLTVNGVDACIVLSLIVDGSLALFKVPLEIFPALSAATSNVP